MRDGALLDLTSLYGKQQSKTSKGEHILICQHSPFIFLTCSAEPNLEMTWSSIVDFGSEGRLLAGGFRQQLTLDVAPVLPPARMRPSLV